MARRAPALLLLFLLSASFGAEGRTPRSQTDLTNFLLGPDWSVWLVGPISRLATPEEVRQFLALKDDAAAAAFVEAFWQRRDPSSAEPGNPVRAAFEERAAYADRRYSEAGRSGRRTDRGILYVLYGPPEKVEFEVSPVPHGPPLEAWTYGAGAPSGLDGKRPAGVYRFIKNGDVTVLYRGRQPSLTQPLEPVD